MQGGQKVERTRELFEQAVDGCAPAFAKPLYLLYASFEEDHGLARHAMHIYERAAEAVPQAEKYEVWQLYIKRAATVFGVTCVPPGHPRCVPGLVWPRGRLTNPSGFGIFLAGTRANCTKRRLPRCPTRRPATWP